MRDRSSSDSLGVDVRPDGGRVVVVARGDLDLANVACLEQAVRAARTGGPPDVVLDLRALTFVDCTGLGLLLALERDAQRDGGSLAISDPSPALARLLDITGLGDHFGLAAG